MPFDLRCPDCTAKLRLDEKPGRDEAIECPKCGSTFTPAESAAADRKSGGSASPKKGKNKKKEGKVPLDADGKPLAKEARERTFFNPFALLAIILAILGVYGGVCWAVLDQLGKSGRVEDMVEYIPRECNTVRGVSLQTLNKYPGYDTEARKYSTATITDTLEGLAKANNTKAATFRDYMVCGKGRDGKSVDHTVYVIRCDVDLKPDKLKAGLNATDEGVAGGRAALRMPADAPGLLAGALVDLPTRRHVVIVPVSGNTDPARTMGLVRAAAANRGQSFAGELGDTGGVVMRGHAWLLLKTTGDNASVPTGLSETLKTDFASFSQSLKGSKMVGMWNSFGGNVRFGGAMDCGSSSSASSVAKAMKEGPLGQGDDVELPRSVKQAFSYATAKEFGGLLAKLSFRSSGTCAYYTSSMQGEQAMTMLSYVGLPTVVDGGVER